MQDLFTGVCWTRSLQCPSATRPSVRVAGQDRGVNSSNQLRTESCALDEHVEQATRRGNAFVRCLDRPDAQPGMAGLGREQKLSEDQMLCMPNSAYMNVDQVRFFRGRLLAMRDEALARVLNFRQQLNHQESSADSADRASAEEGRDLLLRLLEREALVLDELDEALRRIHKKEYGYCIKTGEPIGIPRLLAYPTAAFCVEAMRRSEKRENTIFHRQARR